MKHILTACIIAIALAGCASHKGPSSLKTSKSRSTTATSRPKPKQAPAIKPADDTAATAAPRPKPAPAPEQTATVEKVTTPEPAAAPEPEADKPITVKGENFTIRQIGDQSVSQSGKEGDYYVIIGSFKKLNNAQAACDVSVRQGFLPSIMENDKGLYRVSVYNGTEKSARRKVAEIRNKYAEYADVWLLIMKK